MIQNFDEPENFENMYFEDDFDNIQKPVEQ